jgi:hypothetical protein
MKDRDVVGQLHQVSAKLVLQFHRKRSNGSRELADDPGIGERAGQAKEPEPGGRKTGGDPAEITGPLTGEDIAE